MAGGYANSPVESRQISIYAPPRPRLQFTTLHKSSVADAESDAEADADAEWMEATLNPPADLLNAVREVILAKKFVDRDVERIHLKVVAVAAVVFLYMVVFIIFDVAVVE